MHTAGSLSGRSQHAGVRGKARGRRGVYERRGGRALRGDHHTGGRWWVAVLDGVSGTAEPEAGTLAALVGGSRATGEDLPGLAPREVALSGARRHFGHRKERLLALAGTTGQLRREPGRHCRAPVVRGTADRSNNCMSLSCLRGSDLAAAVLPRFSFTYLSWAFCGDYSSSMPSISAAPRRSASCRLIVW